MRRSKKKKTDSNRAESCKASAGVVLYPLKMHPQASIYFARIASDEHLARIEWHTLPVRG
jgi:hypothetical protein